MLEDRPRAAGASWAVGVPFVRQRAGSGVCACSAVHAQAAHERSPPSVVWAGLKTAHVWCVCFIICLQGPGSGDGWAALLTAAGHPVQPHARFTHEPRADQPGCWRRVQPNEPGLQPDKSRLQPHQPDVQPDESRLQPNKPRLQPDQPGVQPNKPRLQVCVCSAAG